MRHNTPLLATGLLLSLTTLNAEAALTAYTAAAAGNTPVVYSSVSDITWTADANLLGTMIQTQGYNAVVNAIIAANPIINDTPNYWDTPSDSGYHNVTSADFDTTDLGRVNWFGVKAFTGYLNSINYAGSNQWALPSAGANPQWGHNQTDGQFGQLFYNELGGIAGSAMPDTANFTNVEDDGDY